MNSKKSMFSIWKRLLSYIVGHHKLVFGAVLVCILISSCTVVVSSLFLEILIDDYITPMLVSDALVFDGLLRTILFMAVIYLFGTLCTFLYNRLMIKISQALPQLISAVITIVVILVSMFMSSVPLTILVLIFTALMILATQKVGGKSARYFIRQQKSLADVNGYVEEMINGQKVIKVFCHEEKAREGFRDKNRKLCHDSVQANKFGNVLMPIIMQLGNLQYVLLALIGGLLAINGIGSITVGLIVAFLNLSKTFCMPVSQISQQISMMAMALAGAERIFELIDEEVEQDEGYVTLVHACYDHNGQLQETQAKGSLWAWKHPHRDGSVTYVPLTGDIQFSHVDFGYVPEKMVLHNIDIYARPGQKIAFVGSTGAGKTTITNLLNRFYDIADGKIRYDGINISKIRKPDLRRSLGVVLQDVNLFTGTIMDNIRYGRLSDDADPKRRLSVPGPASADLHCPCRSGRSSGYGSG